VVHEPSVIAASILAWPAVVIKPRAWSDAMRFLFSADQTLRGLRGEK
jgi:hypothetical protein